MALASHHPFGTYNFRCFFLNLRTLVFSAVTENDILNTDNCIFHISIETDTKINADKP